MKLKYHLGVISHGSIVEFQLTSKAARDWWSEHVEPEVNSLLPLMAGMFGDAQSKYVEHRCAQDIYEGMKADLEN